MLARILNNTLIQFHPSATAVEDLDYDSSVRDLHQHIRSLERVVHDQANALRQLSDQIKSIKSSSGKPRVASTETNKTPAGWVELMIERHSVALDHLHGRVDAFQSSVYDCGGICSRSGASSPHPVIGNFHTGEVRRMDQSPGNGHTTKMVSFRKPYSTRPGIPVALTSIDMSNGYNIRVDCRSLNVMETYFEMDIGTWSGSQLYQASCAWLEIGPDNPDFLFGTYDIRNDRRITFTRQYLAPPVVLVWLTRIDMIWNRNWRVKAYATDITRTGFTIHIDTWGDSTMYGAAATWVSYTHGMRGVYSGTIAALAPPRLGAAGPPTTGYTEFGDHVFSLPPRVMMGISSLDINCDRNLRLTVGTLSVDAEGMTWYLGTWGDTTLYAATASYIALS